MTDIKLKKSKSPQELQNMRFKSIGLQGEWLKHLGDAVKEGSWFIYGPSGNGKTHYALQLAKYLAGFGRVEYNSIEQGDSATLLAAFKRVGMIEVNSKFGLLNKESLEEFVFRLKRKKSANIVFVDSLQTLRFDRKGERGITYTDYRKLLEMFPRKLFIFISKAKGPNPWNDMATNIKFDSHIKIWVENYYANIETTRYEGGGEVFDIWKDR